MALSNELIAKVRRYVNNPGNTVLTSNSDDRLFSQEVKMLVAARNATSTAVLRKEQLTSTLRLLFGNAVNTELIWNGFTQAQAGGGLDRRMASAMLELYDRLQGAGPALAFNEAGQSIIGRLLERDARGARINDLTEIEMRAFGYALVSDRQVFNAMLEADNDALDLRHIVELLFSGDEDEIDAEDVADALRAYRAVKGIETPARKAALEAVDLAEQRVRSARAALELAQNAEREARTALQRVR